MLFVQVDRRPQKADVNQAIVHDNPATGSLCISHCTVEQNEIQMMYFQEYMYAPRCRLSLPKQMRFLKPSHRGIPDMVLYFGQTTSNSLRTDEYETS